MEVPPARVSAAVFEAAPAGDLPSTGSLLDKCTSRTATCRRSRTSLPADSLSDDVASALVRFWKDQRYVATRVAYPGTTHARADIRGG